MPKQKKEATQIMIIKTLLVILFFAGMGIIIIGGGCIMSEYYQNETKNRIIEPVQKPVDQKLNIIGSYRNGIMSMCAQNCNRYYIGSYELINELEGVDGNNEKEILFAIGEMVEVEELPTIAGPNSRERTYPDKVEAIKFKIDNYQKIDFPKISISEKELTNYLENKNTEFIVEFENPLNEELKIKIKLDDFEGQNNFQYFILKPNETKIIQYIYERDDSLRNKRGKDDALDLVVINDFVDEENHRKYYWDEANSLDSSGIMIYIDKSINLEDCMENDISNWRTYRNEELGFEVKYPEYFAKQKTASYDNLLFIEKSENGNSISMSVNIKRNYQVNYFEAEEIKIGDRLGYKYFFQEGAGYSGVMLIQLEQDALELVYDVIGGDKNKEIFVKNNFNQILSTFKFIEN